MSKFSSSVKDESGATVVTLSGIIDEDVDFSQFSIAGKPAVKLKLSGVKSINSCGIREWIKWITANTGKIELVECPKVIVDQVNMVDGFLPQNALVSSFYVPYYNDDSGSEKNVLYTFGKEYNQSGLVQSPTVKDEDGNEMEMDVVEAKYFKFLRK